MTLPSDILAAPPSAPALTPGPSPYHESSQFRHWRYSAAQIQAIRQELNTKSVQVVARNTELEKEAQISLGHAFTDPPPPQAYLTVSDELLLLRFYCSQVSKICRHGFGLPEVVESTAITYLKRFYLKNSVMEWHPKNIMPTCLFLAAKTTNYPVLVDAFVPKFAKLTPADVLDTEFLVAQSLSFEFWVRGAEKALRGWSLDFQSLPTALDRIQRALPTALDYLAASRLTDVEFIYSPSQVSLACFRLADRTLVDDYLNDKYESSETGSDGPQAFGIDKQGLLAIVSDVQEMIKRGQEPVDVQVVKGVDRRLKQCTNPEKTPGTALFIKRKQEKDAEAAAVQAAKSLAHKEASKDDVFGDVIRRPLSPRVTVPSPNRQPG